MIFVSFHQLLFMECSISLVTQNLEDPVHFRSAVIISVSNGSAWGRLSLVMRESQQWGPETVDATACTATVVRLNAKLTTVLTNYVKGVSVCFDGCLELWNPFCQI